jgi:hypothetical protein
MNFLFTSTSFQSYVFQLMNGKFHEKIGIVLFAKDAHLLILVYSAFTADPRAHTRLLSYRLASNIFRDLSSHWHKSGHRYINSLCNTHTYLDQITAMGRKGDFSD